MWQNFFLLYNAYIRIILSFGKQEVDKPQIRNWFTQYISPYWCSVPNIKKLACMVPEKKNAINCSILRIYQNYSKFRQTGSWQATYSKLSYTIQFSILMLCAKYQEAGMHGSWENMWHTFCVTPTTHSDPYMHVALNAGDTINGLGIILAEKRTRM